MFEIKQSPTDGTAELIYLPGQSEPCGVVKVHNRGPRFGLGVRVTFLSATLFREQEFIGFDAKQQAHDYVKTVWDEIGAGFEMLEIAD